MKKIVSQKVRTHKPLDSAVALEKLQQKWSKWLRSEEGRLKAKVRTKEENAEYAQVYFCRRGLVSHIAYQRFISTPEIFLLHCDANNQYLNSLAANKSKVGTKPPKPLTLAQAKAKRAKEQATQQANDLFDLDNALRAEGLI